MGYFKTSSNGQVQYKVDEFFIDTPEDLEKLPTNSAMGSIAICIENAEVYIKDSTGQWKIFG